MSVPDPQSQQLSFGTKCQERAGFLIPRPCRNPATVQCTVCHRPVCGDHTANLPHGGLACTSCAAAQNAGPGAQQRSLLGYYGYDPYPYYGVGWGPHIGYTHSDFDVFDRRHDEEPETELTESLDGS